LSTFTDGLSIGTLDAYGQAENKMTREAIIIRGMIIFFISVNLVSYLGSTRYKT